MNDATRKGVSVPAFGAVPARPKQDESSVVFDNDVEGADDITATSAEVDATTTAADEARGQQRNTRDDLIDGMHAKVEAQRRQERADAGLPPEAEPIQPEAKSQAESQAESQADETEDDADPLAAFTVMKDGKPMFKTVINGKEQLIPMDRARDQLQKAEAAEVRMARAADTEKALKDREARLLANEQALTSRLQTLSKPPSVPVTDEGRALSEAEILRESEELVSVLFTGTKEQAAAKLAKTLTETRRAAAVPTINPEEIGRTAVQAAKQMLSQEALEKDVATGYEQFGKDYPEILADNNLFRYADGLTDTIAAENPGWSPSKVMLEAGKATKAWIQSMKAPAVEPSKNSRQSRKDGLVPIPKATSARRETGAPTGDPVETPSSMLNDIRKARGQA